jgi:hypothetical protein
VPDITTFLLLVGRWRGLLGSTEGARYHILLIACKELTWPHTPHLIRYGTPNVHLCKYAPEIITECERDDVVSKVVQKVRDITTFLLLVGRWRDLPWSTEGSRYHILFIACGKMTRHPRNYRRCQISRPFYCLWEDDVASQEVQKVPNITSFLLLAGRWRGLLGTTEGARYHDLFIACGKMTRPPMK